jgi:hypothetical protein
MDKVAVKKVLLQALGPFPGKLTAKLHVHLVPPPHTTLLARQVNTATISSSLHRMSEVIIQNFDVVNMCPD